MHVIHFVAKTWLRAGKQKALKEGFGNFPPDNFPSLFTRCRTFPLLPLPSANLIKRSTVNVYKIDSGAVDRLGSGIRVSASFHCFNSKWGGKLSWGEIYGENMSEGECPTLIVLTSAKADDCRGYPIIGIFLQWLFHRNKMNICMPSISGIFSSGQYRCINARQLRNVIPKVRQVSDPDYPKNLTVFFLSVTKIS